MPALHHTPSLLHAEGMDSSSCMAKKSAPHFGEEQGWEQEAGISFFFCATSHDCFCCLTQGFWPGCVLLLLLSGKFKCFGANTVPSSDGCPAKAPHCSCSNMFFWKG